MSVTTTTANTNATTNTSTTKKEKNEEQFELEQQFVLRMPAVIFCLSVNDERISGNDLCSGRICHTST